MTEFPVTIKFNTDKQSLKKAEKEAQSTGNSKKAAAKGGFVGGLAGSILGDLLKSVKMLLDPLSAIATLLVAALFPLFKPFLILFLKIGLLLFRWLNQALSGLGAGTGVKAVTTGDDGSVSVGDKLKSALFIIGGIIGAIVGALIGAPVLLIGAIAILSGLLLSKVGGFLIEKLLQFVLYLDKIFQTDFFTPLKTLFEGIANIFQGLWNLLVSIFKGEWDAAGRALKQILLGLWQVLKAVLLSAWETLKGIFRIAWTLLKEAFNIGRTLADIVIDAFKSMIKYVVNKVKSVFSSIKSFFTGGGGSSKSVNDGIITPDGDLIRTNPNDYIIATKTPGALMGGGGGSNANITINVQGVMDDRLLYEMSRKLQRVLNIGGNY